jgi:hypothetical protein
MGSWNWIQLPWQMMTTPVVMILKIVTPVQCAMTLCLHILLVPSDHVISAVQQGYQAFPLVKLKDSNNNVLGHAYHSLSPIFRYTSHNHDWLPQCSLYATALMLLHVIISLWSHLSLLMMVRRSQEHSMVLNNFLKNHITFMMK